jgi:uncharacterized cupredoxin-like copper-binding protein
MQPTMQHLALLVRYTGISFVAGAVNHGMFSEQRAVLTAAMGVLFFLIGGFLDMRADPHGRTRWVDLLGFGIVASIGLGFFTGGLQHFPDSPERSQWVVPLGFFLSLLAMFFTQWRGQVARRTVLGYAGWAGVLVIAGSLGAARYLEHTPTSDTQVDGHSHSHATPPQTTVAPSTAAATSAVRNVVIEMDDSMRFTPATVEARVGEPLRFIVINQGKLPHEFVLGKEADLVAHATDMQRAQTTHHHHQNALSVKPGETGTLLWTFDQAGVWGVACFEPGHYAAGMRGEVRVSAK